MTAGLPIIVVAGLGRCGSSLAMQMLHAGGIPCAGEYPAFEDIRSLAPVFHRPWADELAGRAVKLLDRHALPIPSRPFVSIWLDRDRGEQAKSMLKLLGVQLPGVPAGRRERRMFKNSLVIDTAIARARLAVSPSMRLNFEDLINGPEAAARAMQRFLASFGFPMDAEAAARVVRSRGTDCLSGFLELEMIA